MTPSKFLAGVVAAVLILASGASWWYSREPVHAGRSLSRWVEDLGSADYQARNRAQEALKLAGGRAAPALIRGLRRQPFPLQSLWAAAQRRFGGLPRPPTDAAAVRERAAEILGALKPQDPRVPLQLVRCLRDTQPNVRLEAERALRKLGPLALDALMHGLREGDPVVRAACAKVLGDAHEPRSTRVAVPALAAATADSDSGVRRQAVLSLGSLGCREEQVFQALTRTTGDGAAEVRAAAADSLGRLSGERADVWPTLRRLLRDPSPSVRVGAARALWRTEQRGSPLVPVLIGALVDRAAGWQAAYLLGEMGPLADESIPALIGVMRQERGPRPLRETPTSAFALGQMGGAAAPALVEMLAHPENRVKTSAAIALGLIGRPAAIAIDPLWALIRHRDSDVRQAATLALGQIGPQTPGLIPALAELSRDDDIYVASAAATLLQKLDPAAAAERGPE